MTTAARRNSDDLEARARTALQIAKRLKTLEGQLEPHKVRFRQDAGGTTLKVPVKGLGQVMVKAASKGGVPKLTLDAEALEKNSALLQQLIEAGVVSWEKTKPRAASVEFQVNV